MKYIISIALILILSLQGLSQNSIDAIVNKRIGDSLATLQSDTIKQFVINGNAVIFPDTLQIPLNTYAQYEVSINYRNTSTGQILGGNKIVIIQRSGAGDYNIVYDPAPSGNITKTQWTLGKVNGLLLIRLQGQIGGIIRGDVSKYLKLLSRQ